MFGTNHKVDRLFEPTSFQLPRYITSDASKYATIMSSSTWHSCFGHASLLQLKFLCSSDT